MTPWGLARPLVLPRRLAGESTGAGQHQRERHRASSTTPSTRHDFWFLFLAHLILRRSGLCREGMYLWRRPLLGVYLPLASMYCWGMPLSRWIMVAAHVHCIRWRTKSYNAEPTGTDNRLLGPRSSRYPFSKPRYADSAFDRHDRSLTCIRSDRGNVRYPQRTALGCNPGGLRPKLPGYRRFRVDGCHRIS